MYRQAGQLIAPDPELLLKMVNDELRASIKAFQANVERSHAFWRISPFLIEHAVVNVSNLCYATWELTGKPFLSDSQKDTELSGRITKRIADEFDRRFAKMGSKELAAGYDFDRALDRFEEFVKTDPDFEKEVFGIFLSQIVAMWTAFESLAADLWHALLVCDSKAISNPSDHSFQSLSKTQKAYAALVPKSHEIDSVLMRIELRKLILVRNVALHRAGVVDEKYLMGAEAIGWSVSDELNKPLQITGAMVRDLLNPVIQAGMDLIFATNRWINAERSSEGNQRAGACLATRVSKSKNSLGEAPRRHAGRVRSPERKGK